MNSQGEGNNSQSPTANAAAVADLPGVGASSNPLANLENVVNAAKEAAAVQQTAPVQSPAETPQGQFQSQFGEPSTDNLVPEPTQPVVETLAQPEPEQTPAEKLKQGIADSVDEFLEEVTKQKVTA